MNFEEQLKSFGQILAGTKVVRVVELPLANSPGPLQPDQPETAAARAGERQSVKVGIRALVPMQHEEIAYEALNAAKHRGVDTPDDRNPIYSYWYNVHLLARACVDPNDKSDEPRLFFGATVAEAVLTLQSSPHLTRDSVIYLAEHQETWQDQIAPQATRVSDEQLYALMGEVAASTDASPFLSLRPLMRLRLLQFTVGHLLRSLEPSSLSDSDSLGSSSPGPDATKAGDE